MKKQKWQKHLRKVIIASGRRFRVTVEEPADWFVTHNAFSKKGKRRVTIPKRPCPNHVVSFLLDVTVEGRQTIRMLSHITTPTYHDRKIKYNTREKN